MGCGASSNIRYVAGQSDGEDVLPSAIVTDEVAAGEAAERAADTAAADTATDGAAGTQVQVERRQLTSLEQRQPGDSVTYVMNFHFAGVTSVQSIHQMKSLGHGQFIDVFTRGTFQFLDGKKVRLTSADGKLCLTSDVLDDGVVRISAMNSYVPLPSLQLADVSAGSWLCTTKSILTSSKSLAYTCMTGGLMEAVKSGAIRLIRGHYIEEQWSRRQAMGMLQELPEHASWDPEEAARMWAEYGPAFFLALSYAWTTSEHPDPELYHLERLARIVSEYRSLLTLWVAYFKTEGCTGLTVSTVPPDVGVFWDYCSLPQHKKGHERTPEQVQSFKQGLAQMNTVYGHERTTVLRCKGLPAGIKREYDHRGWPLFEVCVADTKPAAAYKVFVFDSSFNPNTQTTGYEFFLSAMQGQNPPFSFDRFEGELNLRLDQAAERGEPLFTNGSDSSFVLQKYSDVWQDLCEIDRFTVRKCQWSPTELQNFCEILPKFVHIVHLELESMNIGSVAPRFAQCLTASLLFLSIRRCDIGPDAAVALADAIRRMGSLKFFRLQGAPVGDVGMVPIVESLQPSIETIHIDGVQATHVTFEAVASSFLRLPKLRELWMSMNFPGEIGARAIANAIVGSGLQVLNMSQSFNLQEAGKETVRAAWAAAQRSAACIAL